MWQQSSHQLLGCDPPNAQSLPASLPSTVNLHLGTNKGTPVGNEADQLFIGGTLDGPSRDTDLDRIPVHSDTFCSRRVRLNMHGEEHPVLTVSRIHRQDVHMT